MIWFGVMIGLGLTSYIVGTIKSIEREQKMLYDIQTIKTVMEENTKKIEALQFQFQLAQQKGPFKNELR